MAATMTDVELRSLCTVVAKTCATFRLDQGLVYCWLTLSQKNPQRFSSMAKYEMSIGHVTVRNQLDLLIALDLSACSDPVQVLFDHARNCPLVLLLYLDHSLAASEFGKGREWGTSTYPEAIYSGYTPKVGLDAAELASLGLSSSAARFFLIRRDLNRARRSPVQRQASDPHRYNPNWVVVAEIPDLSQPTRYVRASGATLGLQTACHRVRDRVDKGLRVYLAEFDRVPDIESQVSAAAGAGQLWIALGLRNLATVVDDALEHLRNAKSLGADVVVFPELSVPEAARLMLQDWVVDKNVSTDEDPHTIGWVIAGSFHQRASDGAEDGLHNVAFGIDRSGRSIEHFSHKKMTSVCLDDGKLIEGNVPGEVIDLIRTPLGVQSVVICLDLAQDSYTDRVPLERLPIEWLWVPSLSQAVDAHMRQARRLNLMHRVHVVCANQGSAQCTPTLALTGKLLQSFVVAPNDKSASLLAVDRSGADWQLFRITL